MNADERWGFPRPSMYSGVISHLYKHPNRPGMPLEVARRTLKPRSLCGVSWADLWPPADSAWRPARRCEICERIEAKS